MIDLGHAEPWDAPERRGVRPGTVRIVAAVVSVLLLGLLGGGGRPDARQPLFRLRASVHDATLVRDTLVVQTIGPARLRAYRMPDGHPRWSRDLPSSLTFMSSVDDLLFVTEYPEPNGGPSRTRVLDGRSGRELWQRESLWIVARTGDRLVSARSSGPSGTAGSAAGASADQRQLELSGLDARTGVVLWSQRLPAGAAFARTGEAYPTGLPSGDGLDAFATDGSVGRPVPQPAGDAMRTYDLAPDGVLRTRDPATGAVTASARLAVPPGPDLAVVGRVALVRQQDGTIWASDVAGGEPLWHRRADPGDDLAMPCGDAACPTLSNRTAVLDPVTGARQYEADQENTTYRSGGRIVSVDQSSQRIDVIDPATGRRLTALTGWSATGMYAGTRLVAAQGGLTGPTWIAMVDLTTGRKHTIARADRGFLLPTCAGSGHLLVCWNGSGLRAWSVSPSALA